VRREGSADSAPRPGRPATAAEDWARIRELLRAALEREPGQRSAFLDEACGTDAALRQSVDALLAAHEEAGDFLESPDQVDRMAADVLGDEAAPALAAGSRVGRYEILELLDTGGMGEVYRARDTGLHRDVAVKVMRPWMTRDTSRLRLFEKEARAAGAGEAAAVLRELDAESRHRFVASYDFAVIHAGLGEADLALAWLDKSLTRHDPETMILPADPRFDSLRGDPRFVALLERMSLPRR